MKKVKLIHHGYLSARNGANTVMRSLLESKDLFAKQGIEIKSLTPDNFVQRSFEPNSPDANHNMRRAKVRKWLTFFAQRSTLASSLMIYLSDLRPAKKIISFYINSNPRKDEVVFFHSLIPCYYYLRLRKCKQKTVLVCHTNGDNFKMDRTYYPALRRSLLYRKLLKMEQYVIENADKINFVAEMAKKKFLELHPTVNEHKVSFIYNGSPEFAGMSHIKENKGVMEFCCVGSISSRKGQHYIVDALKEIPKQELPSVHFTFVGDGPERERLERIVNESGLDNYCSFVGVSFDVDKYLLHSDAFILISEDEGLPPIISTPVGGIPEMIDHGNNGLLINPSVEDVVKLLKELGLYDWKKMGEKARICYLEKFSLEKMVREYCKLLDC